MQLTAARPVWHEAAAVLDRRLNPSARAPVVVALSGGSDSLALLLAAAAWARTVGRRVLAVTIDHGLQPQSAAWTKRAEDLAASAGADFRALAWLGPKPATGVPAAARGARHRLLAQAAQEAEASVILLGHTLDDASESALMRRDGSSLGALQEWSPSPVWPQGRGLFHCRPLLGLRRAELRSRLTALGLGWIEDPANDDLRYARARARNALVGGGADATWPKPTWDPCVVAALAEDCAIEPFGFQLDRAAFAAADLASGARWLSAAMVCAGGGEDLPRPPQATALAARLAGAEILTANLAGARVEAGSTLRIMRQSGARAAATLAPLRLSAGRRQVWDGRYEFIADEDGWTVGPLAGQARSLPPRQQARLREIPPAARPALPGLFRKEQAAACPVLAESSPLRWRPLWGDRLRGACGVITREA